MGRLIGLHLRLTKSFLELAAQAQSFGISTFQCFGVQQPKNELYKPTKEEVTLFNEIRVQYFKNLYFHGSYWINLCRATPHALSLFYREYELAVALGFTHFILHSGAGYQGSTKKHAIDQLVLYLDKILEQEMPITLVLENTSHGNVNVGSDLSDFVEIKKYLQRPNLLKFCIDTAHAHGYGYSLATPEDREHFFSILGTIDIDDIVLLHLNDTESVCGSRIDHHAIPGLGNIGITPLKAIALSSSLKQVPIIIEPPIVEDDLLRHTLRELQQWDIIQS